MGRGCNPGNPRNPSNLTIASGEQFAGHPPLLGCSRACSVACARHIVGPCKRPLVCLPTAVGTRSFKNIIYLVDTGAPITELSPHAFDALGVEAVPVAAHTNLNGQRCHVRLCAQNGNHPDIPVLGADYMSTLQLLLLVNYKANTVTLDVVP